MVMITPNSYAHKGGKGALSKYRTVGHGIVLYMSPTQYKHGTLLHLLYNYSTLYVCTNMVLRLGTSIVLYFK